MKKTLLKGLIGLFVILGLFITYIGIWGTSDLRTDVAKTGKDSQKAEALIRQMGLAHGIARWDSIETYQAIFEDQFLSFIGKNSTPFKETEAKFELQYIPGTFDGRLRLLSGADKGKSWGIQSWKTYIQEENGPIEPVEDQNIYFWLPTYQYFIEFPLRIQEANSFAYAGEMEINGIACEGILASWNTVAPQRDTDQYLVWIDKESKRIVKLEYTIREMFNFLTGAVYFEELKNYGGLLLPGRLPVESNLQSEGYLHEMRILDFTPNVVDMASLRPNKELPISGGAKEN